MPRYYLSQPVFNSAVGSIDRENGIIRGITVARAGPARGHQAELDKTFLLQIVDQANDNPQGIKARFGHPNMCSTALGTYLGRFHDYAYQSDKVTATLKLDPTSKSTPNGNLFDYIINMAASNPDMFGASLVFESDKLETHTFEEDGKQIKKHYFRLKSLRATDIVDEPAATDGLFSASTLSGQATQLLDENPELAEFIFSKPDSVIEFLHNYLNTSNMNLTESIKSNFRKIFALDSDVDLPEVVETIPAEDPDPEPQPALEPEPEPEPVTEETLQADESIIKYVNVVFKQFLEENPTSDIIKTESGFAFTEHNAPLTYVDMLLHMLDTATDLLNALTSANAKIQDLSDRLSAKPSIPAKASDPQIGIEPASENLDETGKQIIKNASPDDILRLRAKSKNPRTELASP